MCVMEQRIVKGTCRRNMAAKATVPFGGVPSASLRRGDARREVVRRGIGPMSTTAADSCRHAPRRPATVAAASPGRRRRRRAPSLPGHSISDDR